MKLQPPKFLYHLFPELTWKESVTSNEIFLTFDDGPHPDITPKVLNILAQYNARTCFFCVGENVKKYPETFQNIIDAGQMVGNHTFNHLNGWKTPDNLYLENIEQCSKEVISRCLRPPYGKIKPSQIKKLKKNYQIVMWSVITYDYDSKLSPEACLDIAIKNSGPGDIVVFHDSLKAEKNLLFVLPLFLEHFSKLGYRFNFWK